MAKSTQNFRLHEIMKSGEVISKEKIAKVLGVKLISVPVYIHELKSQFKAKIESVREGRKVIGYKLVLDSKALNIPQYRKNSIEVQKKLVSANNTVALVTTDGSIPVIDKDAEITQVTEREVDDIRMSLGVGSFSARNDRYSE
jgi:biotin operon repressor